MTSVLGVLCLGGWQTGGFKGTSPTLRVSPAFAAVRDAADAAAGAERALIAFGHELRDSIRPGQTQTWATPSLTEGAYYSVDISLDAPSTLTTPDELVPRQIASPITFNVVKEDIRPPAARVTVSFVSAGNATITKGLHSGDPSTYFIVRAAHSGAAELALTAPSHPNVSPGENDPIGYRANMRLLAVTGDDALQLAPNTARDWQHALHMALGRTVFGTSDDIEYLYNINEGKNGWQWLTFDYTSATPKLAFFELDLLDRDVPCTMKIYRQEKGTEGPHLTEYTQGKDPTEIRHDDQTDELVDFKFMTRVLTPGRYYLSVKANHPSWSLRTSLYDVPPYRDPQKAVDLAMRYMVDVGDSFFSNTPRKGAVRTRAENVTDETERCITCHPAHFTMLATLTAARNGYTIRNHPEFKFMMDKLYNAPAPLYGFKNTAWLRFELAPTNGISRLGKMLLMYEDVVSHRPTATPEFLTHYPQLVYDARDSLPRTDTVHYMNKFQPTKTRNYEFDGNRPISDFRVATDSWFVLHQMAVRAAAPDREGNAEDSAKSAAHIEQLMTSAPTNDLEDIVEQTKGLAMMMKADPGLTVRFEPIVKENIQKIFDRQHTDGGWVTAEYMSNEQFFDAATRAPFEKKTDPSLQFMTGEVLYALKLAGYNMQDARVQKATHWLLGQQLEFGGWLDNKGELFLQPHLETSWAIMGLSQMYPRTGPALAPAPAPPTTVGALHNRRTDRSSESQASAQRAPLRVIPTLNWLDQVWYDRDPAVLRKILPLLQSPEPLVRAEAAAAIGRMAVDAPDPTAFKAAVVPLARVLGDRTKMTSRAAAWSLRQIGNDGVAAAADSVTSALASPDDYTRRGAARVFYQYWYHMVDREGVAHALIAHVDDPDMLVRIESLKALWRWWYRTEDFGLRRQIERAFLERAGVEKEQPLVRLNVAQAIYNILDDNTVQFHSNWLRSMALKQDREQAEAARIIEVERPMAQELAAALTPENPTARQTVLTALDYYFLRGGIGNDYDSITFYDHDAAETMARAILPLLDSADPVISGKALEAAAVARDAQDRDLLLAVMRRLNSGDQHARQIARQELIKFPAQYSAYKPPVQAQPSALSGGR
ncbi:MAG TPA: HEAT repeat domain-containing protein [Terriglobia bacterium]|nr:HEAT repeat domain-containing protein [Terriglobia bacterium]